MDTATTTTTTIDASFVVAEVSPRLEAKQPADVPDPDAAIVDTQEASILEELEGSIDPLP